MLIDCRSTSSQPIHMYQHVQRMILFVTINKLESYTHFLFNVDHFSSVSFKEKINEVT